MRVTKKFAIFLMPLALTACTETQFLDSLGAGKSSPDEKVVNSNQPLIMPPDLSLRPPANEIAATQAQVPTPEELQAQAPITPPSDPLQQQASLQPSNPAATPSGQLEAAYAKYGISKFHADGTPKRLEELQVELDAAILAEKKKNNPNYGTIWNWREFFGM